MGAYRVGRLSAGVIFERCIATQKLVYTRGQSSRVRHVAPRIPTVRKTDRLRRGSIHNRRLAEVSDLLGGDGAAGTLEVAHNLVVRNRLCVGIRHSRYRTSH